MPSEYHCPRCKSEKVIVYDDHIECTQCGLRFFIKDIESDIDEENLLSEQEKKDIIDGFDELKDEETRRKFLKSLDEDLKDLDDDDGDGDDDGDDDDEDGDDEDGDDDDDDEDEDEDLKDLKDLDE